MFAAKVLTVLLVFYALDCAIASQIPRVKRACSGCVKPLDTKDANLIKMVKRILSRKNQRLTFVKILSGTTQVIKGIKYNITFEAKSPDGKYECYTSFIDFRRIDVRYFKCERKN
uniref:Venom cystatin-like protein 4 n=1 Tax=Pristhesancus plagipennis TaxID=1955184 RepID=A0A1Q1NPB1_PRIPG|nr:venom cystatin-like protein 4 [Pristhesancus plagipennis]